MENIWVQVAGRRVHVVREGTGRGVFLIHGFLGSNFSWRHQVPAVAAAGWSALAVDLPGFGESADEVTGNYGHVALADACASVLETLGAGPVHVAGHSMGGKVALWLALRHPALVRSLTLVDASALATPGPVRQAGRLPGALPLGGWLVSRRWSHETRFRADLARFYGHAVAEDVAADYWRRYRRPENQAGMLAHVRDSTAPSVVPNLAGVSAPVQVIWGENDRTFPVAHAGRLAALLTGAVGGARVTVVPGAGHFPHETAPEIFNQVFLASIRAWTGCHDC
ncbi:MAG TPA: alpha/beta fold hydrolase [Symbiobacteriaceae bacterium]|jgi:pimeloyl-ACP methyl ester carboxylesterase